MSKNRRTIDPNSEVKEVTREIFNKGVKPRTEDYQQVSYGFISDIDLRTKKGRRTLVAYALIAEDKGGEDHMTFLEKELARRLATYSSVCAGLEEEILNDEKVSDEKIKLYDNMARSSANLMKQLGIKREFKDMTQAITLEDYLGEQD